MSNNMPKLAIRPLSTMSQGVEAWFPPCFVRQNWPNKQFFFLAISDQFQTKIFKSETTSFYYFSLRVPNLQNYWTSDFRKWGQKTFKRYLRSEHTDHSEILGSYQQQYHQHHVFRAPFQADPHSQTEGNKQEWLLCWITRYKLTSSVVTDTITLPYSARQTRVSGGQADIYTWNQLLEGDSIISVLRGRLGTLF